MISCLHSKVAASTACDSRLGTAFGNPPVRWRAKGQGESSKYCQRGRRNRWFGRLRQKSEEFR